VLISTPSVYITCASNWGTERHDHLSSDIDRDRALWQTGSYRLPSDAQPDHHSARRRRCSIAMSISVCRTHISKTQVRTSPNFRRILPVAVVWPLWSRCDTLCISGFVDDVMFALYNRQRRRKRACAQSDSPRSSTDSTPWRIKRNRAESNAPRSDLIKDWWGILLYSEHLFFWEGISL